MQIQEVGGQENSHVELNINCNIADFSGFESDAEALVITPNGVCV